MDVKDRELVERIRLALEEREYEYGEEIAVGLP